MKIMQDCLDLVEKIYTTDILKGIAEEEAVQTDADESNVYTVYQEGWMVVAI